MPWKVLRVEETEMKHTGDHVLKLLHLAILLEWFFREDVGEDEVDGDDDEKQVINCLCNRPRKALDGRLEAMKDVAQSGLNCRLVLMMTRDLSGHHQTIDETDIFESQNTVRMTDKNLSYCCSFVNHVMNQCLSSEVEGEWPMKVIATSNKKKGREWMLLEISVERETTG